MKIRQLLTRWKFVNEKKLRQRIARFEQLEARHLLAAAVWTNVLQALDVTGDKVAEVSPLDALLVINELNHPVYAGRSQPLPLEIDDSLKHPFIDVTCDGVVSPLDALLVINRLNARNEPLGSSPLSGRPTWEFNSSGGSVSSQGKYVASACSPKLIEGDSYTTQLSARVTLPDASSAVRVTFDVPSFDVSSQQTIRDAVEIVLLDELGQPLALPFGINRDASYNWSESLQPAIGPGTQTSTSSSGLVATATFNLSGLAAGTKVQVVARLVNEDKDSNTSVRVQRVEIVDIQDPAPTGMAVPSALRQSFEPIDPQLLVDVSPSIRPVYGRTSLDDDQGVLVTDLQLVNQGNSALSGRILVVIDNLSDPAIGVMHPDGFLDGGRPYFVLNGTNASGWLAVGESTAKREVRFNNPSHQQFTYTLTTLAELNSAPSGFTSTPLREIETGRTYESIAHAEDPDGQTLRYSLVAGPVGMTIDQVSGQVLWVTSSADVGNHSVVLRATDPFGLSVEQTFTIAVIENLPNRPPIFTSTPPTDATVAAPFEVQTFKTGDHPVAVTAGDFGTGISFVTANPGDATLGFLGLDRVSQPISVGEPTPTSFKTSFVTPLTVDLGFSPGTYENRERDFDAMQTADVNHDGTPDLIVTVSTGSSDQFNPGRVGHIGIRLGNGDGTFRKGWETMLPPVTNRGSSSYDLHYADLTSDGIEDILLTQYVGQSVVVYKGLVEGTFAATPTVSRFGGSSPYMQVADVNGDEKLDVVVFENKISGQFRIGLSVLLGNGDGTFGPESFYAGVNENSGPGYIVDVDGKNGPDLVRTNYTDQRLETRLNDGTGHFGETLFSGVYALVNSGHDRFYVQPITAYFGDFDGDGINDASISSAANGLLFLKGTGTGAFGDGTAAGNRFNIAAYVNYGTNTFPATYRGDGTPFDFNADGKLDVLYGDSQYGYLTLGTGRGDGTFSLHSYNVQLADDIGIGARGSQPTYRLNVADYNRDGVFDVAIGSQLDGSRPGSLAIILGDQVGTLRAVSTVPFGERQFGSSVVGDFTGDGIPDIAAHDGQGIIVAVGHGDGTFDDYLHGLNGGPAEIHSLVSADFDGDGNLDLAWQGFTGLGVIPTYYQAFGLGNGFFQLAPSVFPPQPANAGRSTDAQEIATGDFNGDGHPDLAYRVTDAQGSGDGDGGFFTRVDVLLYNPTNKRFNLLPDPNHILGPLNVIPAFYIDEALGYADLNGDGQGELFAHSAAVIGYSDRPDTPERLYVWQPTRNPAATDASQLFARTAYDNPHLNGGPKNTLIGFAVGDFNRDGKPDFAGAVSGATVVSYGNGDFTFRNPTVYLTNNRGVQAGDVNGDGLTDLITSWNAFINFSQRPLLSAMIAQPNGTFGNPEPLAAVTGNPYGLAVGDFNLDGRTDFSTASSGFYSETFLAAPPGLAQVQSGDINGDGKLDLVGITTGFNRVKVLLGRGDNTFTRQSDLFVGASPVDLKLMDIDSDGRLDIITANRIGKSITVLHNNGNSYTKSDYALTARPNKLAVLDITGDNRPDVIAISDTGQQLNVLVNSATGLGTASASNLGFSPSGIAVADVNGDGKVDAVITDPVNKRIFVLPGQGDGSFGNAKTVPLSVSPVDVAIADMNFDGKLDIIVTAPESDRVGVLFNLGGGRFTNPQTIKVGETPDSLVVQDVNSDNKPDLLVTNRDNTLSVILNRFDPANLYRYTPTAIDPDGDPIAFDFENAPGGMLYDDATGQVLWAPMPDQVGNNEVALRVSDNRGGSATQGYTIAVTAPTTTPPPVFTSQPVTAIPIDAPYSYQPSNTNPGDNPLRYSLASGPEGMTVDPTTGAVTWDPRHNGLSLGIYRTDTQTPRFLNRGNIQSLDSPSLRSPSVTAEGWFKFDSNEGFQSLIRKNIYDQYQGYAATWSLENRGGVLVARVGDSTDSILISTSQSVPLNEWLHLAMSFDNSTKTLTLYMNGLPVANGIAARPIAYDNTNLVVGVNLLGTIAGIRVWNTALTANEIKRGMNADVPANSPGLVLDYDFTGGPAAATVLDLSPSQNHGGISTDYNPYNFPPRLPALSFTGSHAVTLKVEDGKGGAGTQTFNIEIVSQQRGSISGTVSDSVTHTGLDGWTAYVDVNRNNYRDVGEVFATTNALGHYTLGNLLATTTPLAIEARSGFTTPEPREVNVFAGQAMTSGFEIIAPTLRVIQGRVTLDGSSKAVTGFAVYIDANSNAVRDAGESFSQTDRLGDYSLSGLSANNYVIRVDAPAGWNTVTPTSGKLNIDLTSSATSTGNDFALSATTAAASTPVFVTTAPASAVARSQYRYAAVAVDPLARPVSYRLLAGPAAMSVDSSSGVIAWTPTASDIGETRVILRAMNDTDGLVIQDFSIIVAAANSAPIITSKDNATAFVDKLFRFNVLAQDVEQLGLHFALGTAPSGMVIDGVTGRITWTPANGQLGNQSATVIVSDGVGGEARQTLKINVLATGVNSAPVITTSPRATAQVGRSYVGRALATDIDGDLLSYSIVTGPSGLTITDNGRLNWTPTAAQVGSNALRVRVDDGYGGRDERDFSIAVGSSVANHGPVLRPVEAALAVVDKIFAENLFATDADRDAIAYQLIDGPTGLSLDSTRGTLRWQPDRDQLGVHKVTVRALDPFGGLDEESFNITVRAAGGPPAITSVPPTSAAVGKTYSYAILAKDADGAPLTYALSASPSGMTIDATTGIVVWTPVAAQVGPQSVIIRVSDGVGGFTTQSFSILVTASVSNQAPVIHTRPPLDAVAGTAFTYALQATDPEGSNINYALRSGPVGFSINPASGLVSWTPTAADVGTAVIVLSATDAGGAAGVQSFLVSVQATNNLPTIVSTAPASVSQGGLFRYDVIATDKDHEPLTYEVVNGPAGLTLDSLGRARWQTALDTPLGTRSATFIVRDGRGGSATQTINFSVVADTTPPRVAIIVMNGLLYPWSTEPARVKVTATDDVGVANITLTLDGEPVALAPDGTTTVYFSAPGNGKLRASAFDAAGNEGKGSGQVSMRSGGDDGLSSPPITTAITSVSNGDEVQGFVTIVGTAKSDDLTDYVLSYRKASESTFHEISRGTASVTDGVLGKWDTTLLENDQYVLQLQANDVFGGFASTEREVGVIGDFKLGNFRLSFTDITIPVAGIPITLARTYDTLRADHDGELGFGWSLEFRNANLRTGLTKTGLENLGIYAAFKEGTKVYLTLPGGAREGFTFTPDIRALPGFGNSLFIATPRFTPDRGVKDTLSVRGGTYIVNEFGELVSGGGQPYNPAAEEFGGGYTVTTPDGITYRIDGNTGLLTNVIDRNNNTLTFNEAGISGPGNITLMFERDNKGRITKAVDPAGSSVKYGYNSDGNLSSVTDRLSNVTRYTYKTTPAHYLDSVIDPLGRKGARVEYGPDGRLSGTIDALGNRVSVNYDPDNSIVTTVDALGNPTASEYDPRGNVVATTNALGGVTRTSYDADGNVLSKTDPLGNTSRLTYDAASNPIAEMDPLGNVTRTSYDAFGNVLSITDSLGRTSRRTYDPRGNLTGELSTSGAASTYLRNGYGQLLQAVRPGGFAITLGYAGGSQPAASTDWNGQTANFGYDANGRPTTRTLPTGTETTAYDAHGRVTAVTDLLGHTARTVYDAAGQVTARIDAAGNRTTFEYDADGRLVRTTQPDGSLLLATYDAVGRLVTATDSAGRVTRYEYDAVGRQTAVMYPDLTPLDSADNPRTRTEYDAAGRVTTEIDELGNRTEFEYDAAGRRVVVRDPLRNVTRTTFDATGAALTVTDPLGRVTAGRYDEFGRRIGTVAPDGTLTAQTLDDRGVPLAKTDENGRVNRYEYTPGGQLAAVIDSLGNLTRYEYDARGKLVTQTDANGHVTRFEYDLLERETARLLPGGQACRTEYDTLGRVAKTTDPNGNTLRFAYDSLGRVTTKTRSDGVVFAFTYTAGGQVDTVTDPIGVTRFEYDARDRLLSRTEPDGQAIRYTYDAAGRTTSMTTLGRTVGYAHDADGRMTIVTDPGLGTTQYTYDAGSQLTRTDFASGLSETRKYDRNGRLVRQTATEPSGLATDFQYTLDPTGRVLSVAGGGETVEYTLDAAYRLVREQALGGRDIAFTYDAVGNRLTRTGTGGSTTYEYDTNDRLIRTITGTLATNYTFDAAGNQVRTQTGADRTDYTWDAENRMTRADVTAGGTTTTERYQYDAAGNRVAVTTAGGETRYLLDLNGGVSQVAAEYTPSGLLVATSVRGVGVIGETRGGASSVLLTDRIGSVRVVVNAAGAVAARYTYDAFGNMVSSSGSAGTMLRFAGEPQSLVTGLGYFRARMYDPATGRFTAADPFVGVTGNPFSRHRYQYADLDPVNKTDPTGMFTGSLAEVLTAQALIDNAATVADLTVKKKQKDFAETLLDGVRLAEFILAGSAAALIVPFGATAYTIPGKFDPQLWGKFDAASFSLSGNAAGTFTVGFSLGRFVEEGTKDTAGKVNRASSAAVGFSLSYDLTHNRLNGISVGLGSSITLVEGKAVGGLLTLYSISIAANLLTLGYSASPTFGHLSTPMSVSVTVTALHFFKFTYELFPGLFMALASAKGK